MATLKSIKNKYLTASDGALLGVDTNTENIAALSFKLATADSLSKFNLVDGFSDDYNDSLGIDTSGSTDELRSATDNYFSGGVSGNGSGGTVTTYTADGNDYKIHSFLTTSTFTISGGTGDVDVLVVASGGGAGGNDGNNAAGGGGGGGMREITGRSMTEAVFDVTVGAASTGKGNNSSVAYSSGAGSSFVAITGTGGGVGGGTAEGGTGGSGGGAGGYDQGGPGWNPAGNEGGYSPVEGYDGGKGSDGGGSPPCPSRNGGGGGGAGAVGSRAPARSGQSTGPGGAGGVGRQNSWRTGSNVYYAGGGGGGGTSGAGSGGSGGGANGGSGYGSPGGTGTTNTGGGAGGGSHGTSPSTSGSGIVVLRYIEGAFVAYNNMTLQSNSFTAQAEPTTARIILDEESINSDSTLNTDLKAYASRDNGTTFTQITNLARQSFLAGSGIGNSTVLMLHCNGVNDGTTFTDSTFSPKTVTVVGDTHTDTAIKKFGTASAQFDGTGDYLTCATSDDWNFGGLPFTIDCWVYHTGTASDYEGIISHRTGGNGWEFKINSAEKLCWYDSNGATEILSNAALVDDTWYHVAVTRNSVNLINLWVDGNKQTAATTTTTLTDYSNTLFIGDENQAGADNKWNGYMDEIRITKGVCLYTANFSPASNAYSSRRLISGSVDISGQPAGTDMKYKITTHNQALTKQTRVYGTSMAWA